jgi:hypothetical protein
LPTFQIIKALMMEAASTSETSVNSYQIIRRNNQKIAVFNVELFASETTLIVL